MPLIIIIDIMTMSIAGRSSNEKKTVAAARETATRDRLATLSASFFEDREFRIFLGQISPWGPRIIGKDR